MKNKVIGIFGILSILIMIINPPCGGADITPTPSGYICPINTPLPTLLSVEYIAQCDTCVKALTPTGEGATATLSDFDILSTQYVATKQAIGTVNPKSLIAKQTQFAYDKTLRANPDYEITQTAYMLTPTLNSTEVYQATQTANVTTQTPEPTQEPEYYVSEIFEYTYIRYNDDEYIIDLPITNLEELRRILVVNRILNGATWMSYAIGDSDFWKGMGNQPEDPKYLDRWSNQYIPEEITSSMNSNFLTDTGTTATNIVYAGYNSYNISQLKMVVSNGEVGDSSRFYIQFLYYGIPPAEPTQVPEPTQTQEPTQPPYIVDCSSWDYDEERIPVITYGDFLITPGDCFTLLPGKEFEVPGDDPTVVGWPEVQICPQLVTIPEMSILGFELDISLFALPFVIYLISLIMKI